MTFLHPYPSDPAHRKVLDDLRKRHFGQAVTWRGIDLSRLDRCDLLAVATEIVSAAIMRGIDVPKQAKDHPDGSFVPFFPNGTTIGR